jgi:hypothetical protein
MKKIVLITLLGILVLTGSLFIASCQPAKTESALLKGAVSIGPLTPVQKVGECPTAAPGVFAARKIMVYDASGKKLVQEVAIIQIDSTANDYYTVLLAPGTYTVDFNHAGIDRAGNLPQKITLAANQTVTIDVNLDTGIR